MIDAALNGYSSVCEKKVKVTIRKDGIESEIKIMFMEGGFFHFSGLHYFDDLENYFDKLHTKRKIYLELRDNASARDKVKNSEYYNKKRVQTRLEICAELKTILEGKFEIFKFVKEDIEDYENSEIVADFILKFSRYGSTKYIFLVKGEDDIYYFGSSAFEKHKRYHHTKNQYGVRNVEFPENW